MKLSRRAVAIQYLSMALIVVLVRLALQLAFSARTAESVASSVSGSLSLAGWILLFGIINVSVDFKKLLSRAPRVFNSVVTTLSIALSLVPAIAIISTRVRTAVQLRSTLTGFRLVRSIAVPVVSSAVEQAMNLADSIQSRTSRKNPVSEVNVKLKEFAYPDKRPILAQNNLKAIPGTVTLIHGKTGSGKSTLLKLIQANTPGAAFVGQAPRETFLSDTVFDELAFAPRQLGKSDVEVNAIVNRFASKFMLNPKADPLQLSAGWQQRVAIAAALTCGSKVLLLDEPLSALDQAGTNTLLETLTQLKNSGHTVLIAEHRISALIPVADVFLKLENGKLIPSKPSQESLPQNAPKSGTIRVLMGQNGSGKTTFLNRLAKSRGVLVPQPASDLLYLDTVVAELEQADREAKVAPGSARSIFESFVEGFDNSQNPRDLSEGQKLALAISIQLTKNTDFLMLDEPTLGFDFDARRTLANHLIRLANSGVEVLVATHDRDFAAAIGTESVEISEVVGFAKQ